MEMAGIVRHRNHISWYLKMKQHGDHKIFFIWLHGAFCWQVSIFIVIAVVMDDFGAKKHLVLRMALEWHISVHVSHYFYPFSGSICLTAPCSFILTFAPLKFSSVPSPNSSIAALHVSLNFAFPSRVFTAHKKFHSHSSFFRSHSLPLPLSPLSVCPSLFHVHAHLSSGVSCCPVGFFGGRQVERRIRDEETDRERGTGERERGQRGRESVTESERERWREGVKYF